MRKIEVKLQVYVEDDGSEFYLPTDKEIREAKLKSENDIEDAQIRGGLIRSGMKEAQKKAAELDEQVLIAQIRKNTEKIEAKRNELLPRSEPRTYTLTVPPYPEYQAAQRKSESPDPVTGEVKVDRRMLMDELLPYHVEGKSPEEVREMDPTLSGTLWYRLDAAMFPSQGRLLFL